LHKKEKRPFWSPYFLRFAQKLARYPDPGTVSVASIKLAEDLDTCARVQRFVEPS
jgi:hypothetical protein